MTLPLWQWQQTAIDLAKDVGNIGFFAEMGVGKTRAVIETAKQKHFADGLAKTLIFCPLAVVHQWREELLKYSDIPERDIGIFTGASRADDFMRFVVHDSQFSRKRIAITNYDSTRIKRFVQMLHDWLPEVMILDESHRVKDASTQRAKTITALSDKVSHKYILTGTPILNSPADIFSQYRILDGGATFGKNFYVFRSQWFHDKNSAWGHQHNHFPNYQPRPELYKEFNAKIYQKAIRVKKEDCLDLPDLVRQRVTVEMSDEQKRLYDEMKKDFITWVRHESLEKPAAVVANMALTKALRLQQIVSGIAKDDNGVVHRLKDVPRLKVLEDLLSDIAPAHKTIIWSIFRDNYVQIAEVCKKLKIGYVEFHGEVAARDKQKAVDSFKGDDGVRVFISNPASGSEGLNLFESSYSIFYNRSFSYMYDTQAEARNYRAGSERHAKVTRIDFVTPETIDEATLEAIEKKENMAETILDWASAIS